MATRDQFLIQKANIAMHSAIVVKKMINTCIYHELWSVWLHLVQMRYLYCFWLIASLITLRSTRSPGSFTAHQVVLICI